jgi:hypothetical protein
MDAGLAAVLGAVAGAIGTTTAGLSTGWAAQRQAKITARSAHLLKRGESREIAYKAFLAAATTLREHLITRVGVALPDEYDDRVPPPDQAFCTEADNLYTTLRNAWLEVSLVGPESVLEPAGAIADAADDLVRHSKVISALSRVPSARAQIQTFRNAAKENMQRLSRNIREFSKLAQQALDRDGTDR